MRVDDAQAACELLGWSPGEFDEANLADTLSWARVSCTPQGSAKPREVAEALGLCGKGEEASDEAWLARLGFQGVETSPQPAGELASDAPVTTLSIGYLSSIGLESSSEVSGQ